MATGATISERLKRAAAVNEFRNASITVIVGFIKNNCILHFYFRKVAAASCRWFSRGWKPLPLFDEYPSISKSIMLTFSFNAHLLLDKYVSKKIKKNLTK
jgi:hypothetical protein